MAGHVRVDTHPTPHGGHYARAGECVLKEAAARGEYMVE